jgi:predicted  nucleic acid-binding Zn-ribbon protein
MNRLLYELQEVDTSIVRFKRERGKLDDGASLRSERDTLQEARDAEKRRLNTLNTERADKELQLQTTEEKIARQQNRLMHATSTHEVTALQRDIKALNTLRGSLDEAILTLMDEIEECGKRLAGFDKELQEKIAETEQVEKSFAAEAARLDAEIAAATRKRQEVEAQLDTDASQKYSAFAARFHGVAVAHPDKGNCSACGTALTPFNLREARTQQWPTCENCGRLLFIE